MSRRIKAKVTLGPHTVRVIEDTETVHYEMHGEPTREHFTTIEVKDSNHRWTFGAQSSLFWEDDREAEVATFGVLVDALQEQYEKLKETLK